MGSNILLSQEKRVIKNSLFIPLAKVYFVVTGYGIYFGLTRILDPSQFGIYGVVIGLISVVNMVFISGTIQGVSKFISEDESQAENIKQSAFLLQGILGGIIFLTLNILSRQISCMLNDEELSPYIRIASFIFLFYSYYAVFVGHLNGIKDFRRQGMLDMFYSTLKILLILSLAYYGASLYGAIAGFASASFIILLIALLVVGFKPAGRMFPVKKLFNFMIIVMVFTLVQELIMHSDLFLLKALTEKISSNLKAGLYTACLSIARIPFMIMISLSYIIFPIISKATTSDQDEKARYYIYQGMRICLIMSVLFSVLIASSPRETLLLLYPGSYQAAYKALQFLTFGYMFFSLFTVATAILTSSGKPQHSLMIGIIILLCQVALNFSLIPVYGITGAAIGTASAQFIGLLISGLIIYRRFNVFIPFNNLLRIAGASILIYLCSAVFICGGIFLILKNLILILLFFVLLVIIREITVDEIIEIKRIVFGSDKESI